MWFTFNLVACSRFDTAMHLSNYLEGRARDSNKSLEFSHQNTPEEDKASEPQGSTEVTLKE